MDSTFPCAQTNEKVSVADWSKTDGSTGRQVNIVKVAEEPCSGLLSGLASAAEGGEEEEDDETLRAMLLKSLESKKKDQVTKNRTFCIHSISQSKTIVLQ